MNTEQYKIVGMNVATTFFTALESTFATEEFLNAAQIKKWLANAIKQGVAGGYRNLEWKEYKVVFDYIVHGEYVYHVGIDFGQQAVHVTLGPGNVYSLYFRDPTVSE